MTAKESPTATPREQFSKPLNWCPLPSGLKVKLARAGYETVRDISNLTAEKLSQNIAATEEEAALILNVSLDKNVSANSVQEKSQPPCLSLKELLEREKELGCIVTFCARFDDMLGGGIPMGKITEICGSAGTGKTQLCMQLAVDATVPVDFGGVGGHTLYIDTEGSMVVERLAQMARAAVKHITDVAENMDEEEGDLREQAVKYTFDHVLQSIHCYRCNQYLDLLSVVNLLPELCTSNPLVRLVIVDSIANPFRSSFSDMALRNRLLNGIAQTLIQLATQCSLAVVLTNQMVNQFMKKGSGNSTNRLVPTLGESWGHSCTNRVMLSNSENHRRALLFKSPCKMETCVQFAITESGIRDVHESGGQGEVFSHFSEDSNGHEHKSKKPHLS